VRPRRPHIIQRDRIRPPCREQLPAVGVLLDVGNDFEPGSLKSEVKAANPGEKGDYRMANQMLHSMPPSLRSLGKSALYRSV